MIRFFCKLWCDYLRLFWSSIRWCRKRKITSNTVVEKVDSTITSVRAMCNKVYSKFEWTIDDFSQLFDSLRPCGYLYNWYQESTKENPLKDDCDGYHSIIYHILTANGFNAAIFNVVTSPISKSHTMTLYKRDNNYYLVDYTSVIKYSGGVKIQDIVDDYNKRHGYKKEHYWNVQKYNYTQAKFYNIKDH